MQLVAELLNDLTQNQQKISHHGKRAAGIVSGMLQHARAGTGKKEMTDLNALADEYMRLSYHGLRAKDKTFQAEMHADLAESIGAVPVVPQDMGRVFLNLFNNAFYAVHEKQKNATSKNYLPAVWLSTKKTDEGVEIRVRDNGSGIPEALKAKIFQPFFTTKPAGQGTGLGLSLSYDIVTKGHGGTLQVHSPDGSLTEFVIHLPIAAS
jgi:signal transduction histidine kinase